MRQIGPPDCSAAPSRKCEKRISADERMVI